uniref:Uncharacterized protein n=2 Tax=Phaeomonas parva TaxID=124430 RepID=A0A7S1XVZ6_9STRA|mmetsp:Transcript_42282/g.132458  ORF Transcript_42282/g.132458 Transcript_42282/m.132458 type:complete len:203 (+) Transcript_42282:331-939(+)
MKNNPLCGITLPAWLTILRRRWRQIDWVAYGPRLAFITYMACLNTFLSAIEFVLNGRAVRAAEARQEHAWQSERPVFVLGHPRTGTTLLHGMLALDKERFRYCDTFAAGFPNAFLWFEGIGKKLLAGVIDETRPMDNMKLSFDLPQEEELATNVLSAGASPYMPLFFMRNAADFEPLYSFDDASAEDKVKHRMASTLSQPQP